MWWPVAVLLAAVLGACGPPAAGGSGGGAGRGAGSAADYDGQWRLTSGRGPTGRIPVPSQVTLTIDGSKLSGTSACNGYNARATIDGSSFSTDGIGSTMMGCPGKRMIAEERYTAALEAATAIERAGDRLTLSGPDVDLQFAFVPPPKPVALENTTWHLGGLVYGRGPNGTVTDNEPATLTLHDDGTLTGSTGCRKLDGEWERVDDLYRTYNLSASGDFTCPRHRRDQDAHVLDVLDDLFEVNLDVRSLDLYQAGGDLGLFYGADG